MSTIFIGMDMSIMLFGIIYIVLSSDLVTNSKSRRNIVNLQNIFYIIIKMKKAIGNSGTLFYKIFIHLRVLKYLV